ncbi:kinase-like protein [Meira miltonrushii]|uniref:Kinase-like protein n=1 Tax=Meira miltonrushii TaxID=1280837 RepID=A0A316VJN8_9BASI|nr:kinase-like protein [Meira miltonrushii]PWN37278.1 kinase-like protein [Meira miltonrushii]
MDRFDVIKFEDLSGPKGGDWVRVGGGSFGVVFRGEYLGTEVAIKEVLPNNTYDVEKYFERECVLMKEARHPNIVQYIGLTKSPGLDGRIYIVSEFVGPNVRQHIADKKKPFDWPLRISYATDIARAVAYLHARNCMHRDLKGENLLVTDNQRIKVCDFGFARIAARNQEEMRRISYCGTDGYMSPEILMGVDFSLPSDIFSLGVIFCEIISRHLVDPSTFKRQLPSFGVDVDEIKEMASDGCPADFIQLCIDMTKIEPDERPDMRQVIRRLRVIEQEIVNREFKKGTLNNVGSLRGHSLAAVLGNKSAKNKKSTARRLPSFEGQISTSQINKIRQTPIQEESHERNGSDSSDEDVEEALRALEKMTIGQKNGSQMVAETIQAAGTYKVAGHGNPWWDETDNETVPAASWMQHMPSTSNSSAWRNLDVEANDNAKSSSTKEEEYSTSVVRPSRQVVHPSLASSLSKMTGNATMKGDEGVAGSTATVRHRAPLSPLLDNNGSTHSHAKREASEAETLKAADADDTTQSYMTAHSSEHDHHDHHHGADPSLAMATIASTICEANALYHRFTLVKNGTRKPSEIMPPSANLPNSSKLPYQLILANALTKCNVCLKRLGFGAYMDCDDCPYKTHVGCAAMAEPNCQEMTIPGAGGSANGSPLPRSPKRQDSLDVIEEDSIAAQQTTQTGGGESIARTSSPSTKPSTAKSPPSSLSKGVAFLRKRHSKSPPPKSPNSPPAVVRA